MNPLEQQIRELVATVAELDPDELGPDTPFGDVDIDSLLAMEIAVHVEKRFSVRFEDGDVQRIVSIRDLADLVSERAAATGG
jgi:acyl carrier protein